MKPSGCISRFSLLIASVLWSTQASAQTSSPIVNPTESGQIATLKRHVQAQDPIDEQLKACKLDTVRSNGKRLLLTGPKDGYYFKVGKSIASVVRQVEDVPTPQTTCNLLGLSTGAAEFALVQSDIAHDAWYAHPPANTTPFQKVTLVAPLFVEAIHILVRPHLNLATLADLRGRRVWLGPDGSLTVLSARRILDAAGLTPEQVSALQNQCPNPAYADQPSLPCEKMIKNMTREQALDSLEQLELDAMFQVAAYPFDPVRDKVVPSPGREDNATIGAIKDPCPAIRKARLRDPTVKDREIHLFSLDIDLVNRLVQDGSYIEQLIPANTYCQDQATLTLGVRALLLTNRESADPAVSQLAISLQKNQRAIENDLRDQIEAEQMSHAGDPITGLPSKLSLLRVLTPDSLHVRYHQKIKDGAIYFRPWMEFAQRAAPLLFAGGFILSFLLYRRRSVIGPAIVNRGEFAAGIISLLLVWVVASALLYHYEGDVNEEYSTLHSALLSTFQDLFPCSDEPLTSTGQLCWKVCKWIALVIFSGMLLPSVKKSFWPKLSRLIREWLLGLGQTDAKARSNQLVVINRSPWARRQRAAQEPAKAADGGGALQRG